jgi:hypothetical protein
VLKILKFLLFSTALWSLSSSCSFAQLKVPNSTPVRSDSIVKDPEFPGLNACYKSQSQDGFEIRHIDPVKGTFLDGSVLLTPPLRNTQNARNGPEPLISEAGTYCQGTGASPVRIVQFWYDGFVDVPYTYNLVNPFGVKDPTCPLLRSSAIDISGNKSYVVDFGSEPKPIAEHGNRFLSCSELIVINSSGTYVLNVDSGQKTLITSNNSSGYFPWISPDLGRAVVGTTPDNKVAQVYVETSTGWQSLAQIQSPITGYPFLYSVEAFVWQGGSWISAIAGKGDKSNGKSIPIIIEITSRKYAMFGNREINNKDTETVPLPSGNLAVYWLDSSVQIAGKSETVVVSVVEPF